MTRVTAEPQDHRVRPAADTALRIEPLGAVGHDAWDRFIGSTSGGTVFHTTAWMGAVAATFGHEPVYLAATRSGRIVAALPLFEVRSRLAGTLLISVPYAVYGGVVGTDRDAARSLLNEAEAMAKRTAARCVELRSPRAVWTGVPIVDRYVTFRKPLPSRREDCLGTLPRKARAAARAARERYGLTVSFDDCHLHAVWRLYSRTMRRIGSLNYPLRFFSELARRLAERHLTSLVRYEGRPIGGLVTLLFNGVAMPYFVGADARFSRLHTNNFIYLTAMERAVELGCHTFDFGRSRRDNRGCCTFKKNQGFDPETLEYQVYTLPGRQPPNLTPSNPKFALARRVWPALPGCITRPLGAWLSRHAPG